MSAMHRHTRWVALGIFIALSACSPTPGREAPPRTEGSSSEGPPSAGGGMMGRGRMPMMGGMMAGSADTAAAPAAHATQGTAPGCPDVAQALVDEGRGIFTGSGNCFACHGSDARGTSVAPDLTDGAWLDIDGSYAAIAGVVRSGVPHPARYPAPMPAEGGAQLGPDQVCAVAAYVYGLGH